MTQPVPIPTPHHHAHSQVAEALTELHRDYQELPVLPWENVHELVGPPLPRDLWVIGARPANGKTTFLLNLFDHWVRDGTAVLYIGAGAEGPPKDLRRQWAALRLGLPVDRVMANQWSWLPSGSAARLEAELQRQAEEDAPYAHFTGCERLTPETLIENLKYARRAGCAYVLLDHVHRVRFDARTELRRALSETTRFLRDWAAKHEMTILLAAQLHRAPHSHGALRDLVPPVASDLKETGTLEEDAVVILLLHRVKKPNIQMKDVTAVARGERPVEDIMEPETMGVRIGKHRRAGHRIDQTAFLLIDRTGHLEARPPIWGQPAAAEAVPF